MGFYKNAGGVELVVKDNADLNGLVIPVGKIIIIEDKIFFKDGDTKVMNIDLAKMVIDEVSELNLEEIINEINNDDPKWETFKTLEKR